MRTVRFIVSAENGPQSGTLPGLRLRDSIRHLSQLSDRLHVSVKRHLRAKADDHIIVILETLHYDVKIILPYG